MQQALEVEVLFGFDQRPSHSEVANSIEMLGRRHPKIRYPKNQGKQPRARRTLGAIFGAIERAAANGAREQHPANQQVNKSPNQQMTVLYLLVRTAIF